MNGWEVILLFLAAVASLPTAVFFWLPSEKRRGAAFVLPVLTVSALAAIVIFVVMVNAGALSP